MDLYKKNIQELYLRVSASFLAGLVCWTLDSVHMQLVLVVGEAFSLYQRLVATFEKNKQDCIRIS